MTSKAERPGGVTQGGEGDSHLQLFFDLSVSAQVLVNVQGEILLANPSFASLVGRDPVGLAGTNLFELLAEGPNAPLRAKLAAALGQNKHHQEIKLQRPDGSVCWLLLSSSVDVSRDRCLLHLRDFTGQQQVQRAIRALAAGPVGQDDTLWKLMVSHLVEALDMRCAFVAKLRGGSGQPRLAETLAVHDRGIQLEAITYEIAGTPSERVVENRVYLAEHSIRAHFPGNELLDRLQAEGYLGVALTDRHGRVIGLLAVMDDKPLRDTERVLEVLRLFALRAGSELEREEAVESLRLSEERFELAVRGSSHGLWDWNIATGEFYAAPGYRQILGYQEGADFPVHIDGIFARIHAEDLEACKAAYLRHVEEGGKYDVEFRMRHFSGDYLWVRSRAKVKRDEKGNLIRMSGSIVDVTTRKEAQMAIAVSQERLQKLTAGVPGAVFEIEQQGGGQYRLVFISDGVRDLLGLKEGEALDQETLRKRLDRRSRIMLLNALVKSGLRFKPLAREIPVPFHDGQRRWLQIKAVPERLADGNISWRGLLTDITQSKWERLEQQAVAAVARFCLECQDLEELYETVPRLMATHFGLYGGMVRRYSLENGTLTIVGGHRLPEAGPFAPEKALDTACGQALVRNTFFSALEETGGPGDTREKRWGMRISWCVPLRLGASVLGTLSLFDSRSIEVNEPFKRALLAAAGSLAQAIHRLETASQLGASEERYRRLVELSPVGIFMVRDGRFLYANPMLVRMLGYRKQSEILGRNLFSHLEESRIHAVKTILDEVQQQGREYNLIGEKFRRADGAWFDAEFSAANIQLEDKPVALVVVRDTTEHNQLEEAQAKSARLESVGVLAGGIAHDFNNFLAGMMTSLSVLQMSGQPGQESKACLRDALEACKSAQQLTKQLLTFGKGGSPVKETTHLGELAEQAVRFVLRGSNIEAEIKLPPDLWAADVDAGQIRQVLHNLVLNARQAMPTGGKVTLEARNLGEEEARKEGLTGGCGIEFSVRDTGLGIPLELQHQVFDPYFSTKESGTGLGLAVCHSIVKKHNGSMNFNSEPGQGSEFRVLLPASPKTPVESPKEDNAALPRGDGRLLIMDDNDMILKTLSRLLQKLGYEAVISRHGEECLALYREAKEQGRAFDAVILDLTIQGGMGGAEAAIRLKEYDPAARTIASSGYADDDSMTNYQENGFDAVLPKPYTRQAVSHLLQRLLKRPA